MSREVSAHSAAHVKHLLGSPAAGRAQTSPTLHVAVSDEASRSAAPREPRDLALRDPLGRLREWLEHEVPTDVEEAALGGLHRPRLAGAEQPVGSPRIATAHPTPEVSTPGPSWEPTPTFYTSVSFDLRSIPHRAPYDVDSRFVSGRVDRLMQRVREAAGEPAPRLLVYPGASAFRAEFFGRAPEALSQCQRAVDAVVTPETDPGSRSPLAELDAVRATPCAAIEAEVPASR